MGRFTLEKQGLHVYVIKFNKLSEGHLLKEIRITVMAPESPEDVAGSRMSSPS